MKGWLIDTNVIAALINPNGAPSVKAWAAVQPETRMFISVLSLGEYDKGIHNLAVDHPDRSRYIAARDALAGRFVGRTLSVSDPVVRRWGEISGAVKRRKGQAPAVIDTLLAATALEHDLFLVTRNTRDVQDSGAAVFNPWTDDPADFPLA
ncbi:MAG: VapC toxin family PIN domain ribonuclease [Caulobacter sp. 12-67-6]|nr:MAG: VapC toxin family PIN domain ribonuclease [Caulobacter sp. 12-67-6]OYX93094.1 MAG: VapC toxin family PIN domain ribonuclease [Caulobacter sp. 35-67-4]OZA74449.1 MAG: VapC toxin family PIN domain ribonuclease [Caulobacter sp. 39-67-4]